MRTTLRPTRQRAAPMGRGGGCTGLGGWQTCPSTDGGTDSQVPSKGAAGAFGGLARRARRWARAHGRGGPQRAGEQLWDAGRLRAQRSPWNVARSCAAAALECPSLAARAVVPRGAAACKNGLPSRNHCARCPPGPVGVCSSSGLGRPARRIGEGAPDSSRLCLTDHRGAARELLSGMRSRPERCELEGGR